MKIVAISDTHNQHRSLKLPEGDMIIHAGDVSGRGYKSEVDDFLNWFSQLDFMYKIMIAGNHDFYFEDLAKDDPSNPKYPSIKEYIPEGITYLNDSGVTIEGVKIWGSPVQPWFHDWAFNRMRGSEIKYHWNMIPLDTDILITHGPAFGIHDECMSGNVGCKDLLDKINIVKPKLYVCGHIHEAYGVEKVGETTFVNASVLNERYEIKNPPVVLNFDNEEKKRNE